MIEKADLIADDWEILEPKVEITRAQFWEAVKATAVDMRDSRQRIAALAERLGLGEPGDSK